MDPLTLGIGAIGLGLKLFGGMGASSAQSQANAYQQQAFQGEIQVNQQRQQAMEISARRNQLENIRNTQRARSQGLNAAVTDGAQFGSGLPGAQGAATDRGTFNALGITQNLQIGRSIFGLDNQITQAKANASNSMSTASTDQGWASMGGSILSSTGTIGNLTKSAGGIASGIGGWSGTPNTWTATA